MYADSNQGFDSSLMGSINAVPNYIKYYGLPDKGTASTGIVFAIFQVKLAIARTLEAVYLFSRLDKWLEHCLYGWQIGAAVGNIFSWAVLESA